MLVGSLPDNLDKLPFILVKDGAVSHVSQPLIDITSFTCEELVNRRIEDLFKILRVGPNVNIYDIDEETDYFMFTKSHEVRTFNIEVVGDVNEKLFLFMEKPNFEDKHPFLSKLCSDNHFGMAIFSLPDKTLLKANETYISFFDEPFNKKENCIGKQVSEFVTGFEGSTSEKIWQTIISTGETYSIEEYMYDRFERGITYWRSTLTPVYEDEKLKYCVEMTTDITEQVMQRKKIEEQARIIKQQNEQLKQQKNELEEIIQSIDDAIFIYDGNKKFYLVNKAGKEFYKIDEFSNFENLNSNTPYKYYDENGQEIATENLVVSRASRGEVVVNYKMTFKSDLETRHMSVNGRPVYDKKGNLKFIVISCRDVTQDTETQRVIEQQKELLEAVLENINDAIIVYDRERKLRLSNGEASKMYPNLTSDSLKEVQEEYKYFDLEGNPFKTENFGTNRAYKGETVKNDRIVVVGKDKHQIIEMNASPVFDEDKNVDLIVLCHRDVTEQINQHRQLLDAEREKIEAMEKAIEMKDEFLSLISHEFRTPLNVINTALQAINYFCVNDLPEKARKYLDMIKLNTFRQLRLVNNLLDITRTDAGRIKISKKNLDIVFMSKSITESVQAYASQKGITLNFISNLEKKIIGIDDEKYERILLNLLSNAIKFTPEGKSITVKVASKKGNVCIEVRDEGIGIPKDKRDVIFERFGQVDSSLSRQAEGTGIGLSLVKKFVEALGGSISVKSTLGKGSAFTILVPDETVVENDEENEMTDLLDNRLVHVTNVEFSDIYL